METTTTAARAVVIANLAFPDNLEMNWFKMYLL